MQIGDALLKSKPGEFTGFGEDSFVLPSQFLGLFGRWEVGEGEFHYRDAFCVRRMAQQLEKYRFEKSPTETKVTQVGVLPNSQ